MENNLLHSLRQVWLSVHPTRYLIATTAVKCTQLNAVNTQSFFGHVHAAWSFRLKVRIIPRHVCQSTP